MLAYECRWENEIYRVGAPRLGTSSSVRTDFVVAIGERRYAVERPWGEVPRGQPELPARQPELPARQPLAYLSTVAVDSRDQVYVAQRVDPPVAVFSPKGVFIGGWGSGVIADAHGIFVSADDRVFVVDRDAHQVLVFDTEGNLRSALGERHRPRLQGPFNHPTGVAVAPDGVIYVADGYANAAVHRFSPEGDCLGTWGAPGSGPGEFMTPHAVAIGAEGRVYVADRDNDRVQIFELDGTYVEEWTDFFHPMDVHIDAAGLVHVTDQVPRLSTFTPDGDLIGRCRPVPYMPHGVCGDSAGNLYLVEPTPTDQITKLVPLDEG